MPIARWWSKPQQRTRDWLIVNNGDVVPAGVMAEIADGGDREREIAQRVVAAAETAQDVGGSTPLTARRRARPPNIVLGVEAWLSPSYFRVTARRIAVGAVPDYRPGRGRCIVGCAGQGGVVIECATGT